MKAAIYCRVSTSSQKDEKTIQSQLHELPIYAKSQGWEVFDIYKDEGISGAFIDGREDFKRLLDDMEQKKFDVLLVVEHSRVTRTEDPEERGRILKLLKDNKIKLASPHEGILDLSLFSGELMTTLKLLFASEEKQEISRRMRRGKNEKNRNGNYCCAYVPFPFRRETIEIKGQAKKHTILINPDEEKVLRIAYDQIVNQNKTVGYVADYLNTLNIKPRFAQKWSPNLLGNILRNSETLTGAIITNRYNSKKIGDKKFQDLGFRPEEEWVRVLVPRIFTDLEYKRLDKRIIENRNSGRPGISDGFMLKGQKIRCGECGKVYTPRWMAPKGEKPHKYYVCGGRVVQIKFLREGQKKCNSPWVNQEILDNMVWQDLVMNLFMFPENTLKQWGQSGDIKQGALKVLEDKLAGINKEIEKKETGVNRILDEYASGLFPPDKIKSKKEELDKAITLLGEEKFYLVDQIKKLKLMANNKLELAKGKDDLIKLGKKLSSQMNKMGMADRQKLIKYFIPEGSYLLIHWLNPSDYHFIAS